MKRFSILLAAAALFAAVAGCQKEPAGNADGQEADVYVEFTINFEDGMTKADDHNSSDVAIGTNEEHAVKFAYLYFFDNSGNYAKTVEIAAGNITSQEITGSVVKKTTVPTQLTPGTYNVYATLNYSVSGLTTTTTETAFKEMIYAHNYASYNVGTNGIPMSSRSSDGEMCKTVTVSADNTQDSPVQIQLYVERMLAKLTVKNSASSYTISSVASVSLTHYKPVNLAENAYVYRHVGDGASITGFGVITDDNYVIDPETSKKTTGNLIDVNLYNEVNGAETYLDIPSVGSFSTPMYCAENTMLANNQYKTYGTAFAFAAKVTPAADTYFANNGTSVVASTYSTGDLWYFDGAFYDSLESLNSHKGLSLSTTTDANNYYKRFGVKYFKGGTCYYNYYIRHFNNSNGQSMGKMEFAIVRNNDYQVTVTSINALGEDTPGAAPEAIESGESYFQATLLVRPWVVRAQDAVLG